MTQAELTTARLSLRPLADEHLEHEIELDADPEVLRYLWARARTRAEVEESHRTRLARGREMDGLGLWAGFDRQRGDFIGLFMLTPPHGPSQAQVPDEADLGYRVMRRSWRQGYAGEGSRELIRHGFEDLGLTRIFAQTMAVNVPSRATMESLGLRFVRGFHEHYDEPLPGSDEGEVEYEIRADDWRSARPSAP